MPCRGDQQHRHRDRTRSRSRPVPERTPRPWRRCGESHWLGNRERRRIGLCLLHTGDAKDKPVAPARHRLNTTVAGVPLVKHPPQRRDLNGQVVRLDDDIRPHRVHDCFFGHQRAGLFQQECQDVPRARADRNRRPCPGGVLTQQAARLRVEPPASERQGIAGDGHVHASSPPDSDDRINAMLTGSDRLTCEPRLTGPVSVPQRRTASC